MNAFASIALDVAYVALSLLAVDFLSGVLHWAEDTWTAPGRSKLLDRWIVRDNIEHHRKPGTIRAGDYWGTNRVCIVLAFAAACVLALFRVDAWPAYLIVALASQSNQVHLWAHSSDPPAIVALLQRCGILQSRRHHGEHHRRPYATHYCTMTNFLNAPLEAIRFWRGLEWLIQRCGVPVYRATAARGGY